jgi:PIN like domain
MRVLLDECAPRPLGKALTGHDVSTVETANLKGFENGDLIKAAEGRFDALLTADKNLRYQQNLTGRTLAILELPCNSWPRLKPRVADILAALRICTPGAYIEIT